MTCTSGVSRLMCGPVQWWEALLICGVALLLGFLLMYAGLRLTGRWNGRRR